MDDFLDTRFEGQDIQLGDNLVQLGDDVNIIQKDPTLHNVMIGVGWDSNAFDVANFDLDVSVFLLNAAEQTRDDDDFVYYNHREACNGGVKHHGDSRTGAGEGDDEVISVDLHALPFDVVKIVIVLSIYHGGEKDQALSDVRKAYVRLVNEDSGHELLRFVLDEHFAGQNGSAALIGSINREGPKWHFTPLIACEEGGLAVLAERYGMIVGAQ